MNESLTFDFDTDTGFEAHHYGLKISEAEFDAMFARVEDEGIPTGAGALLALR